MALPESFQTLKLPAIAAPMFLASGPELVIGTCKSGIVGTFPALNQRTSEGFEEWLNQIEAALGPDDAPFGVNLIVHKSNTRLEEDLEIVVKHKVPLIITSLGAASHVVDAVHSYGGLVFHDVINRRHAEKAAEAGVDGIIAVAAGAGGHSGAASPLALISEIREFFDKTIALSGSISNGAQIAAARVMGADMGYLGTRFIATTEAGAPEDYKAMLLDTGASDIVYTPNISGVNANFLRPSVKAAGLDPDALPAHGELAQHTNSKAWADIWSAGHGTGTIHEVVPVAELAARLIAEYKQAMTKAASDPFAFPEASA